MAVQITLSSLSDWLAWFMLMSMTEFPLRGTRAGWDDSPSGGQSSNLTLAVHFTEKKWDPGGALLKGRMADCDIRCFA